MKFESARQAVIAAVLTSLLSASCGGGSGGGGGGGTVAPAAPSSLTGFAMSNAAALFWADESNDEDGFRIERAADIGGAPGIFAELTEIAPDSTQYQDDTLAPATAYWYRVRSFRGSVHSSPTNVLQVVTSGGGTQPLAPSQLVATGTSSSSAHLAWVDNASNEDGFHVERAPDLGGVPGSFQLVGVTTANDADFDDNQLAPSSTYWYRVRAYRTSQYSAYSNADSAQTSPPGGLGNTTSFGTAGIERAQASVAFGGGMAVAGAIDWSVPGEADAWALELDASGDIVWQRAYSTSGIEHFTSVVATQDGGLLFAGTTNFDPETESGDAWLVKTNALGLPVWQFRYDFGLADSVVAVEPLSGGRFLIAGSSMSAGSNGVVAAHGWLLELDSAGAIQWARKLGESEKFYMYAMRRASSGDIVVAGARFDTAMLDGVVARLDAGGNVSWTRSLETSVFEYITGCDVAADGSVWITGAAVRSGKDDFEGFVAHLSAQGAVLHSNALDLIVTDHDIGFGIRTLADGGAIMVGSSFLESNFADLGQEWVARVGGDASLSWCRAYGGADLDSLQSIRVEASGEFVACGMTASYSQWGSTLSDYDAWVLRIQPDGDSGNLEQLVFPTSTPDVFSSQPSNLSHAVFTPARTATSVMPVTTDAH